MQDFVHSRGVPGAIFPSLNIKDGGYRGADRRTHGTPTRPNLMQDFVHQLYPWLPTKVATRHPLVVLMTADDGGNNTLL